MSAIATPTSEPPNAVILATAAAERPFRPLALLDTGAIGTLSRAQFETMLDEATNFWLPSPSTQLGETLERAGATLFLLVAGGALAGRQPERSFANLRISLADTLDGVLRTTPASPLAGRPSIDQDAPSGPRLALPWYSRVGLGAFVRMRVVRDGAHEGANLLPELPGTWAALRADLGPDCTWLDPTSGRPTWRRILRCWLAAFARRACDVADIAPTWGAVASLAAWWLYDRERLPLACAIRRGVFRYSGLARGRNGLTPGTSRAPAPQFDEHTAAPLHDDADEEVAEEAEGWADDLASGSGETGRVRRFFNGLGSRTRWHVAADEARSLARDLRNDDLRRLVGWTGSLLIAGLAPSTAKAYGERVLRLIKAVAPQRFLDIDEETVGQYFDDHLSPSATRDARTAAKLFDEYCADLGATRNEPLDWGARALQAFERYSERTLLTENEYTAVYEATGRDRNEELRARSRALLIVLRRLGLRVSEAAALRPEDFSGVVQWYLVVPRSKTRSGRGRHLPCFLLLDPDEARELRDYIAVRARDGGPAAPLFPGRDGREAKPAAIGREAKRLLKATNETPHGLRHAFANALFAAWWLENTDGRGGHATSWARRMLASYCRPGLDARAVSHLFHIQLMLGHASLEVTWQRYLHLPELVLADAVAGWDIESQHSPDAKRITVRNASRLLRIDPKVVRQTFRSRDGLVTPAELEEVAFARLERLTT